MISVLLNLWLVPRYGAVASAVVARKRVPAATWSSIWYVLSSFAVISYTNNWVYVVFAGAGSWIGAYVTMTFLHGPPSHPPSCICAAASVGAWQSVTQTKLGC